MHAERDYLNRLVFPELRKRCQQLGMDFIPIDLRWGVTEEDARARGALSLCLQEVDRCLPFFLGLIGERYGWSPPAETIPRKRYAAIRHENEISDRDAELLDDCYRLDPTTSKACYRLRPERALSNDEAIRLALLLRRAGLPSQSITEREIERAIAPVNGLSSHCLFYLRRSGMVRQPDFPPTMHGVFVESSLERRRALAELKARIESLGDPHVVRHYRTAYEGLRIDAAYLPRNLTARDRNALADRVIQAAEWQELDPKLREALSAHGTPALSGLEKFGEMVLEDLHRQINAALSRSSRRPKTRPLDSQARYIVARTRLFVGRKRELASLFRYARHKNSAARTLFAVTGEAGSGKSSLLAEFALQARKGLKDHGVVTVFIGVSPGSADLTIMLRDAFTRLRETCELNDPVPDDPAELRRDLRKWLEKASANGRVLLVIDALNQLDPRRHSHELDWLPLELPPKVRLVVSTVAGPCLDVVERRIPSENILRLDALSDTERQEIVDRHLSLRGKRLSPAHRAQLLDTSLRPDARLPLYLLVALEELCLFGDYDGLDLRLRQLPPSLEELFEQVLQRLELDHGFPLAATVCRLIAASRSGLAEGEVMDLLNNEDVAASRLEWTRFYRAAEPYFKPIDEESGAGLLDFFHEQLRLAVLRRYFKMTSISAPATRAWLRAHRVIAEEFKRLATDTAGNWRTAAERPLAELPFHLIRSDSWNRLIQTLCDLRFIQAKCTAGLTYALVADFEDASQQIPDVPASRVERLNDFARFVSRSSHQLALHANRPGFVVQHAHHSAVKGPVASSAERLLREPAALGSAVFLLASDGSRPPYEPRPAIVRTFAGRGEDDTKVAMSGDGRIAISTSVDELVVWDVATGEPRRRLRDDDRAHCIALSADGAIAVSGSGDERVRVWNVDAAQCVRKLHVHKDFVVAITITPDARLGVSGSLDGSFAFWDLQNGHLLWRLKIEEDSAQRLAMSADGRVLLSGGGDGRLRVFDLQKQKLKRELPLGNNAIAAVAITHDGTRAIASDDEGNVHVCNLASGKRLHRVETRNWDMAGLALTPDARTIVGGGRLGIDVIDARSGKLLKSLVSAGGSVGGVTGLAVTSDGHSAMSASYDGELNFWDLRAAGQRGLKAREPEIAVKEVSLSPDGRHAACTADDVIEIRKVSDGATTASISVPGETCCDTFFTLDGTHIVCGSVAGKHYGAIAAAELRTEKTSWSKVRHTGYVSSLAATPDGRFVLSAGEDGTLRTWDVDGLRDTGLISKGRIVKEQVATGPDGCLALSAGPTDSDDDQTVYVWDWSSKRIAQKLPGHKSAVWVLAISPDGRYAASGGLDETFRLWDLAAGKLLRELPGHPNEVRALVFSADGRRILSAGEDRTLHVWDIETGECLNVLAENYPIISLTLRNETIAMVLKGGSLKWLQLHDAGSGPPIVTAIRAYLFQRHEWERAARATCPMCGNRFSPPRGVGRVIADAEATVKSGTPICLQLPEELFQDERLLCRCPKCRQLVRFNPFTSNLHGAPSVTG